MISAALHRPPSTCTTTQLSSVSLQSPSVPPASLIVVLPTKKVRSIEVKRQISVKPAYLTIKSYHDISVTVSPSYVRDDTAPHCQPQIYVHDAHPSAQSSQPNRCVQMP